MNLEELFDALRKFLGVKFIWAEPDEGVILVSNQDEIYDDIEQEIHPLVSRLRAIPRDYIDKLEKATNLAYYDEIMACINQIEVKDEMLALALKELADSFEHDRILLLIHELDKINE